MSVGRADTFVEKRSRLNVICIDDDRDFLRSLEFLLAEEIVRSENGTKCQFLFLNDPHDALQLLGELKESGEAVAMIITDEKMPGMTGTSLLLKAKTIHQDCIRVLLTGHAGLDSAIRAINDHLLDKYLTKPIENEHDFTVTIRHLLDRFQMQAVIAEQNRAIERKMRELSEANDALEAKIGALQLTEEALETSQQQLRQSLKMDALGRLAGGVAHDFNNILTTIMIRSEMAARILPKGETAAEYVNEIHKSSAKAAELTRQLLTFSRKQVLERKLVDLHLVVDEIEGMLRRLIGEDIEFAIGKGKDPSLVMADAGQMDQVIMNLVVNARDAMPNGGKLTIETALVNLDEAYARSHAEVSPGEYVLLAVSDTGCGMDRATRERIFEPFFTTKEVNRGTGLGLSTVYGIVKQSGGHIWVYSEPGLGSCFKVYLPKCAPVEQCNPKSDEVETLHSSGSEVVLLVEDEKDVRELALAILRDAGYEVLDAADGDEALRIRQGRVGPIHLMVSDVVMPRANGPEVYERIAPLSPGMRVLFMSGYTDRAVLQNGMLGTGTAFIQKPFTPDQFLKKVRETLDHSSRDAI